MMSTGAAINWWPHDGSCIVLLVDDDPDMDEAIRRVLASEPRIELHYCRDRRKAPMIARLLKPAVILQDLALPGEDGLSVLASYAAEPATAGIPVILLLDEDHANVAGRARSAGAADCLVTPPDPAEIIARIRQHSRARLLTLERDEALRALGDARKELAAAQSELATLRQRIDRPGSGTAEPAERRRESHRQDAGSPSDFAGRLPLAILVADDNVINQRVATGLLKRLGYTADVVTDGQAVLEVLDRRSYDVILLDRQMPRMDGYEAARQIRARPLATGNRRPLLVAMSANDTARDREDGLAAGMDDFLPKPLDLESVKALLERHGSRS